MRARGSVVAGKTVQLGDNYLWLGLLEFSMPKIVYVVR